LKLALENYDEGQEQDESPTGSKGALNESNEKNEIEATTPAGVPVDQRARNRTFLTGPISKADIGQNVNRFAKRLQEQNDSKSLGDNGASGIVTYTSEDKGKNHRQDRVNSPGEVQEFFQRKTQIDAITSKESQKQDVKPQPPQVPPTRVQKAEIQTNYQTFEFESSEEHLPTKKNNSYSFDKLEKLETLPTPIHPEPVQKMLENRSVSLDKVIPAIQKSIKPTDLLVKAGQLPIEKKDTTEASPTTSNDTDVGSPLGGVIEPAPENDTPPVSTPDISQAGVTTANEITTTKEVLAKNMPSLIITNIFK
jgi:hypothetical protein